MLSLLPWAGNAFVDVCLMDDLGYELRARVDQRRIRGRNLSAMNGISSTILDQKSQEGEDAPQEEADDEQQAYEEEDKSTAHYSE